MEKANKNLKYLLEMGENDIFISKRGELILQDDFVQVDNNTELEYAIYFTFHQLLSSSEKNYMFFNNDLIQQLDESIDNLFDNKQFNELFEKDTHFRMIIDDIDDKIDRLKNHYFYKSPFFGILKNGYNKYSILKNFFISSNQYFSELYLNMKNLDIDDIDGFDFHSDSGSDSENHEVNKCIVKEKINSETGEENPNLDYSFEEENESKKDN